MTIKELPKLDPIQAHWLNSQPLPTDFLNDVQSSEFYKETRHIRFDWWKIPENKLAYQLKFNSNSPIAYKDEVDEEYGKEVVDNAKRHLAHLLKRTNISAPLQCAAISWYIAQMIDMDKTKEQNGWS